jgi:hypothetical protein
MFDSMKFKLQLVRTVPGTRKLFVAQLDLGSAIVTRTGIEYSVLYLCQIK